MPATAKQSYYEILGDTAPIYLAMARAPSGYEKFRAALAEESNLSLIYRRWLRRWLEKLDQFLGDPGRDDKSALARRLGLDLPGARWTAPAYDRCLLLALAYPLGTSGHFPREVVEMIAVGEEANNLEQVLLNISENMEQRTYRELDMFVKLLEPVMLLFMGIVILFIMVALLLPVMMSASSLG